MWLHRDTTRPFQKIPICKCWSLQLQYLRRHSFLHLLHDTSPNTTKRATPTPHIVHLINQPRPGPYSIVVVLFFWVVLHVPIKSYNLVKSIDRSMVRVTWLLLTKSYSYCSSLLFSSCSLRILDSSNFEQRSFYSNQTSGKHTKQTTSTTKNNTPKQKKDFKRAY